MTEHEQRRAGYEQTLLRELEKVLLTPKNQARREQDNPPVRVEDVQLDTLGEVRTIVILFRDMDRPERLFGYAWGPMEMLEDDPYISSTIVWANWEEEIYAAGYGLPEDCSAEGVNWIQVP